MIRADQGRCVLVVRTGSPMFPSKTDHIMSRYRPIAPKPTPKSEGTDQTDSHSLSSLSADKSAKSADCRGKRRSSKRAPESYSSKSPRPGKKTRHGTSSGSGKSGGAEGNVEFQPPSFNLTPIFSDRVAPVFGPGGLQRFKDSFDHSQTGVSVSLSLSAKSPPRDAYYEQGLPINLNSTALKCSQDGLSFNIGSSTAVALEKLEKDVGFMERAAVNSTSLYSAEHSNTGLRRAPFFGCPSSLSTSFGADSEVCSAEDTPESMKANIVTLSLLPDTPSFVNTRSSSSTSTLSLLRSDIRWSSDKPATTSSDLNTSLTMSSSDLNTSRSVPEGFGPPPARKFLGRAVQLASQTDCGMRVVDTHDLEQRHGGSSEAVMLTDERDAVLWVNSAFKRLSNERMSSRAQAIGPHIDPLGIPTQLAILTFQPPFPASKCTATLWGFLKKFIMHEGASHDSAKVIAPQPLRPVGSTITVQSIDTFSPHAAPLSEPLESVQERLDKGDIPSVVTDLKFRVRWANSAYKRLVGQPKCAWLQEAGVASQESPASLRLAGDVSLICDGMKLPESIAAFSCRVGIQWSHQGDHSAMYVPSQVARLDDGYVWGFDICDAGVKNVLQIENASPFC